MAMTLVKIVGITDPAPPGTLWAKQGVKVSKLTRKERLAWEELASPQYSPKPWEEWRDKLTQAQADVTTWTGEVNRLQAGLNDSSGPLYGPGRAAKADALESAKQKLAAATLAIAVGGFWLVF